MRDPSCRMKSLTGVCLAIGLMAVVFAAYVHLLGLRSVRPGEYLEFHVAGPSTLRFGYFPADLKNPALKLHGIIVSDKPFSNHLDMRLHARGLSAYPSGPMEVPGQEGPVVFPRRKVVARSLTGFLVLHYADWWGGILGGIPLCASIFLRVVLVRHARGPAASV